MLWWLLFVSVVVLQADGPLVWAAGGNLTMWSAGDEQIIVQGNVIEPFLSPDGAQVAFLSGEPDGLPGGLFVVSVPDGDVRQLVSPADLEGGYVGDVRWRDANTIFFNTALLESPLGATPQNDLYRVDVPSGAVERLLPPGEGGAFTFSPDGALMALVRSGDFDEAGQPVQDGEVWIGTPDDLRVALTFPPIQTGSPQTYYPPVFWTPDSTALYIAIPGPTVLYDDSPTALWRIPVSDNPQQIGEVNATFFGPPRWSADRTRIAYSRRAGEVTENQFELVLAAADGTQPERYAESINQFVAWAPSGERFIYTAREGGVFVGSPNESPVGVPGASILETRFLDGNAVLFVDVAEQVSLKRLRLGGSIVEPETLAVVDGFPLLDVPR